eukprot:10563862-Karenia_brevis.AAC.1
MGSTALLILQHVSLESQVSLPLMTIFRMTCQRVNKNTKNCTVTAYGATMAPNNLKDRRDEGTLVLGWYGGDPGSMRCACKTTV